LLTQLTSFDVIANVLPVPGLAASIVPSPVIFGHAPTVYATATYPSTNCGSACGAGYAMIDGIWGGGFYFDQNGIASTSINSNLALGSHVLSVHFYGNGTYSDVDAPPVNFSVIPDDGNQPTAGSMQITPNPISAGVTATATNTCGSACGTGFGSILIDGVWRGGFSYVPENPTETGIDPTLPVGTHTIQFQYGGDLTHQALSTDIASFSVIPNTLPVPVLTSSVVPSSIPYGEYADVNITSVLPNGRCASACGTGYMLVDNNWGGGFYFDENGAAGNTISNTLAIGTHTLTVHFNGSGVYSDADAVPVTFSVVANNLPVPVITATPSGDPLIVGQNPSFALSINCTSNCGGQGQFLVDGNYAGSYFLDNTGAATIYINTSLAIGNHTLSVTYWGTTSYAPTTLGPIVFDLENK
jgi:hypothetical protein